MIFWYLLGSFRIFGIIWVILGSIRIFRDPQGSFGLFKASRIICDRLDFFYRSGTFTLFGVDQELLECLGLSGIFWDRLELFMMFCIVWDQIVKNLLRFCRIFWMFGSFRVIGDHFEFFQSFRTFLILWKRLGSFNWYILIYF